MEAIRKAVPMTVWNRLPKGYRPWELKMTLQRRKTRARIYLKHNTRREIEICFYVGAFLSIPSLLQYGSFDQWIRWLLPAEDPNAWKNDPYLSERINEKAQRAEEMRKRFDDKLVS